MIKSIAIDDEPFALEVIKSHAEKVPFLKLEGTFTNAFDALDYLSTHPVDLIFLDIKMPDISGIDFYDSLPPSRKPQVIFTTAYSEHAVTGFDLDALDYLLKPFHFNRFLKACNKAMEFLSSETKQSTPEHIFVKNGNEYIKIVFEDIAYVEATGNYVNFVLQDQQIMNRMTITECQNLLKEPDFVRIHRSFMVAVNKVQKIERHQLTVNGHILPIGSSFSDILQKLVIP